jgi:hypothetical protein
VANRNKVRGGRSRKRRPALSTTVGEGTKDVAISQASPAGEERKHERKSSKEGQHKGKRARPRGAAERSAGAYRDPLSVGERPQAPWHPLPLSELLILVGAIGVVVGLVRGPEANRSAIIAGVLAVGIGTIEVSLREHLSGYRSHTLLLALLPVIVFHSAVVLIVAALTRVPKVLNVGLLLVDAALGTILFKLLRTRYLDGRRERTFAGRR